jgi:hypothetical protein
MRQDILSHLPFLLVGYQEEYYDTINSGLRFVTGTRNSQIRPAALRFPCCVTVEQSLRAFS